MINITRKKVLVLGGTGSIGSEIVKRLIAYNAGEIRVFARDESKHQYLFDNLGKPSSFKSVIGDIRDKDRLSHAMRDIDIVFNAAALKAVPYCEKNPFEAVSTNIIGTNNVIEVALERNIEKVICISTDKAADPTNTYGTTKLLSEKLLVAANYHKGSKRTVFAAVRLGNVLGARNSVLPVIRNQIMSGHPITIAQENMTRFVMTVTDVVNLIFDTLECSKGGEIFIKKMYALYIWDLIDVYIEELSKKYNLVSGEIHRVSMPTRSGEKLYEKLVSDYEENFTYDFGDKLMLLPNDEMRNNASIAEEYPSISKVTNMTDYNSDTAKKLDKDNINDLLQRANIINI